MSSRSPEVQKSLQKLHDHYYAMERASTELFNHHVERLVTFLERDQLMQSVLEPLLADSDLSLMYDWLKEQRNGFQRSHFQFPADLSEELVLRFHILRFQARSTEQTFVDLLQRFGNMYRGKAIRVFKTVIAEPFYSSLWDLADNASDIPSQIALASPALLESVVPSEDESRIFLSHKSEDKPLVKRYENALTALGYSPWLDEAKIRTGDEVDRKIKQAMRESCAAVFFVTEKFKDETYLRDEINYAKRELHKKGNRFRIITLIFSESAVIPDLFDTYRYENVENDLDGLFHIIRGLPLELGPVRWKEDATV